MNARTLRLTLCLFLLGLSLGGPAWGQAPGMFAQSMAAPEAAPWVGGYGPPQAYGPPQGFAPPGYGYAPQGYPVISTPYGPMPAPYGQTPPGGMPGQFGPAAAYGQNPYGPMPGQVVPAQYVQPGMPAMAAEGTSMVDAMGQPGAAQTFDPGEGTAPVAEAMGTALYDPIWYLAVGTIAYGRDRCRTVITTVDDADTFDDLDDDVPVLTTDALRFDHVWGVRGDLRRQIVDGVAVQILYYGGNQWKEGTMARDQGQFIGSPQALSPPFASDGTGFNTFDVDDFFQSVEHTILYRSTFHNGELNLRETLFRADGDNVQTTITALAGARWVNLYERFSLYTVDDTTATIANGVGYYLIRTNNTMAGGQIGFDIETVHQLPYRRLAHGVQGKVGWLGDRILSRSTYFNDGHGVNGGDIRISDTQSVLVSELELYGWFDVNRWLQIRGGYSLLYMEGMSLAPEQFTFDPNRLDVLNHHGGLLLHGANLSFVISR